MKKKKNKDVIVGLNISESKSVMSSFNKTLSITPLGEKGREFLSIKSQYLKYRIEYLERAGKKFRSVAEKRDFYNLVSSVQTHQDIFLQNLMLAPVFSADKKTCEIAGDIYRVDENGIFHDAVGDGREYVEEEKSGSPPKKSPPKKKQRQVPAKLVIQTAAPNEPVNRVEYNFQSPVQPRAPVNYKNLYNPVEMAQFIECCKSFGLDIFGPPVTKRAYLTVVAQSPAIGVEPIFVKKQHVVVPFLHAAVPIDSQRVKRSFTVVTYGEPIKPVSVEMACFMPSGKIFYPARLVKSVIEIIESNEDIRDVIVPKSKSERLACQASLAFVHSSPAVFKRAVLCMTTAVARRMPEFFALAFGVNADGCPGISYPYRFTVNGAAGINVDLLMEFCGNSPKYKSGRPDQDFDWARFNCDKNLGNFDVPDRFFRGRDFVLPPGILRRFKNNNKVLKYLLGINPKFDFDKFFCILNLPDDLLVGVGSDDILVTYSSHFRGNP